MTHNAHTPPLGYASLLPCLERWSSSRGHLSKSSWSGNLAWDEDWFIRGIVCLFPCLVRQVVSSFSTTSLKHSQDFIITGLHVHQDFLECGERSSLQVDSKHLDQKSTLASSSSNGHNFFNFQHPEAILLQSITDSVVYEITSKIKVQVIPQTFSQERLIFLLG